MNDVRYAPVGPLGVLQSLWEARYLGDYLLLIAQDILEHPLDYAALTNKVRKKYDGATVYVDNGVIEHGKSLSVNKLIEAAQCVKADYVILPDALTNKDETLELARAAWPVICQAGFEPILVPQGRDTRELVLCVDELRKIAGENKVRHTFWGIPRWIANDLNSRIPIVQYINQRCAKPHIHLLGMSHNIIDDLRCTRLPNVVGIDSANPIVIGIAGVQLSAGHRWVHMERGNYWDLKTISDDVLRTVVNNIDHVRCAIG